MWKTPLTRPIHLSDGRTLLTLADARDLILALPERDQHRSQWQSYAGLLVSAAKTAQSDLIGIATARLEEAIGRPPFAQLHLVEQKKPPAPSLRRRRKALRRRRLTS